MDILEFDNESELVDFIPAALRNYVLGQLALDRRGYAAALKEMAHTIAVKGDLCTV